MKEDYVFEIKFSGERDIHMILAHLLQAYGETNNNTKTIKIEGLVNNLKVKGSANDLTKK